MDDLIDRKYILGGLRASRLLVNDQTGLDLMERHINNAPAVDAVEVVHADWVCRFIAGHVEVRCSNCGEHRPPGYMSSDYCSKCGARMDGKEKPNAAY